MQLNAHILRAWFVDRRLGGPRGFSGHMATIFLLARGMLLLVAVGSVGAEHFAERDARPGLMPPVHAQLPTFVAGHACISPSDEEPPAPEPEEPPCPRTMQGARR